MLKRISKTAAPAFIVRNHTTTWQRVKRGKDNSKAFRLNIERLYDSFKWCNVRDVQPNAGNGVLHGVHDRAHAHGHDLTTCSDHRYSSVWSCPSNSPRLAPEFCCGDESV